jgi:hypothetical protein
MNKSIRALQLNGRHTTGSRSNAVLDQMVLPDCRTIIVIDLYSLHALFPKERSGRRTGLGLLAGGRCVNQKLSNSHHPRWTLL